MHHCSVVGYRNDRGSGANIKLPRFERDMNINRALRKKTVQSSTLTRGFESWRAVDGNIDSNMTHGSCMHTLAKAGNWWKVFLAAVYEIQVVVVTNADATTGVSLLKIMRSYNCVARQLHDSYTYNMHGSNKCLLVSQQSCTMFNSYTNCTLFIL